LECLILKMKALQFFETLVIVYKSTRCSIPEDLNMYKNLSLIKDPSLDRT
jgi:hypothetical protein